MQIKSNIIEAHIFRYRDDKMEFLLLKRSPGEIYPGLWQMVSGRIEQQETAVVAAIREVEEETGLKPIAGWVVPRINSFYSPIDDSINFVPVFVFQVEGDRRVLLSEEHTEFGWFELDETLNKLSWDGQRKAAQLINEYYFRHQETLNFIKII